MTTHTNFSSPEYEHFKSALLRELSHLLPEGISVNVRSYVKDNGYRPEGISFVQEPAPDPTQFIFSPIFYINDLFEACSHDLSAVPELALRLVDYYHSSLDAAPMFLLPGFQFMENFEEAKNFIVYRLVNTKANAEKLSGLPHREFYDLSLIFMLLPPCSGGPQYTCTVTNDLMKVWNTDPETLYELACENTPRLLPCRLETLGDVIMRLCEEEEEASISEVSAPLPEDPDAYSGPDDVPMFVLTNTAGRHGSAAMLYRDVLKECARKINSDLFILPSSVHEVLLVDSGHSASIQQLREMVSSVNAEVVSPEEVLSDQVYYYSLADDSLMIAAD